WIHLAPRWYARPAAAEGRDDPAAAADPRAPAAAHATPADRQSPSPPTSPSANRDRPPLPHATAASTDAAHQLCAAPGPAAPPPRIRTARRARRRRSRGHRGGAAPVAARTPATHPAPQQARIVIRTRRAAPLARAG